MQSKSKNGKWKISSPLILASASPRRAELLTNAGFRFRVEVSPTEEPEHKPPAIPIELWPMCLAYMKAAAVRDHLPPMRRGAIILAADTIVVDGDRILNKPRDRAHARQMLRSLLGRTHRVITGIALFHGTTERLARAEATCRVKKVSAAWLEKYLDSGLWRGKAGAYGIQDAHDPFITLESGEWSTVVGLPMALLRRELACLKRGC